MRDTDTLKILQSKVFQLLNLLSEISMWKGYHQLFINKNRVDQYVIYSIHIFSVVLPKSGENVVYLISFVSKYAFIDLVLLTHIF